ncbi:MAG: gamma-glutamyltransferase family protein [Alphaproteobacteria bacterium]|nr:gamma-glutamyltransferase family protein [Alphaproteobacteria bacterium]
MPDASSIRAHRPVIAATRHAAASGHYLATQAAFQILEAGGNAVDAGVAGAIALGVLESELVSFTGVAPMIFYMAERGEVVTIDGLGVWPQAASCEHFVRNHGGKIPKGILRSVVPGAPDAFFTALERYGTMSFADVAATAIRFAREGFPMYPLMNELLTKQAGGIRELAENARIYLPKGQAPAIGDLFVQADYGATLQYLADAEAKAAKTGGRVAGIEAARAAFYRGDVAAAIDRHQRENGGLLAASDMADYRARVEPPVSVRFGDHQVFGCGPWCQGPMLLQEIAILKGANVAAMGHNSADYIHTIVETVKLAAADRERYFGDPRFVDVPMGALLDDRYAEARFKMIQPERACPDLPPAGTVAADAAAWGRSGASGGVPRRANVWRSDSGSDAHVGDKRGLDTSYVCVVDRHGNAFSCTPSDGMPASSIVPGLGIGPSQRGSQTWAVPGHPSMIEPGKRPRLTCNPALAIGRDGKFVMPFGTPGADIQTQAMLQVYLNLFAFGMNPQAAVEAPRVASMGIPDSFEPHTYTPGLVKIEGGIDTAVGETLAQRGHVVEWWPEGFWQFGSVCAILDDRENGTMRAVADHRRTGAAQGW